MRIQQKSDHVPPWSGVLVLISCVISVLGYLVTVMVDHFDHQHSYMQAVRWQQSKRVPEVNQAIAQLRQVFYNTAAKSQGRQLSRAALGQREDQLIALEAKLDDANVVFAGTELSKTEAHMIHDIEQAMTVTRGAAQHDDTIAHDQEMLNRQFTQSMLEE